MTKLEELVHIIDDWCNEHNYAYDIGCDERSIKTIILFNKNIIQDLEDYIQDFIVDNSIHTSKEKTRSCAILTLSMRALSEKETEDKMSFESRITKAFRKRHIESIKEKSIKSTYTNIRKESQTKIDFEDILNEALDGVATTTDNQPTEIFRKFAKALQVLGEKMGIGPLQNALKEQGIKWKQSDDGLSIILYVINAGTKAPQPIARITSETLDDKNGFEDQLLKMLDFAKGDAPGSFEQQQKQLQQQEKIVRDVATAASPDENDIAQAMDTEQAGEEVVNTAALPK